MQSIAVSCHAYLNLLEPKFVQITEGKPDVQCILTDKQPLVDESLTFANLEFRLRMRVTQDDFL